MNEEAKLKKLEAILGAIDAGTVTEEQVASVVEALVSVIDAVKNELISKIEEAASVSDLQSRTIGNLENSLERLNKLATLTETKAETLKKELVTEVEYLKSSIKNISLTPGPKGEPGKDGKDGSIKEISPQEVRDLLELLQGDERLDAKYIKNLPEAKEVRVVGGGRSREVKVKDLSDQLDGSTKTFNMPAFWLVFDVRSSSFPYAFRPTVDYTTNASAPSITFTDQVDAPSTLATGQTLYVLYVEP